MVTQSESWVICSERRVVAVMMLPISTLSVTSRTKLATPDTTTAMAAGWLLAA